MIGVCAKKIPKVCKSIAKDAELSAKLSAFQGSLQL